MPADADFGYLLLSFAIPVIVMFLLMPRYLSYLKSKGSVREDSHKPDKPKIPSPAGPVIFVCLVAGELVVAAAFGSLVALPLIAVVSVTFLIGLWDDLSVLGGRSKPLLLVFAAVPLLVARMLDPKVYSGAIYFPILGATSQHVFIYSILVLASVPVVSNAYNMMDAFNGQISGFAVLTSVAVAFGVALRSYTSSDYSLAHLAAVLPLVSASLGFYYFNRYPSRAFDGDSGALVFGAAIAVLAVTCGVEIAAIVAIIPAILNSFYILSSVRGFVERRHMTARPTFMTEDGLLHASEAPEAPMTLVRAILLGGPLEEKTVVKEILALTAVTCALSALTSILTWVR